MPFKLFKVKPVAIFVMTALLFVGLPIAAMSQQAWKIKQIEANLLPRNIVPDTRPKATRGLPDGRIATGASKATIARAWYSNPTRSYNHAILGDAIEGGSLVVITKSGSRLEYLLPESEVFEDITPRLADLDSDGKTEVVTIISSLKKGASLGIFQVQGTVLKRQAQSPYIGRAYRWLNIAGINRYSGARNPEIAIVVTPHIGGRLDLYRFSGAKLSRIASAQGFSNHFIGSREQRLSATYMTGGGQSANLALPSADRRHLQIMSVGANGWQQIGSAALPSSINKAILVKGSGKKVEFTVGLSDGSVYSISPH